MKFWTKYDSLEITSPDKSITLKIEFKKDGTFEIEEVESPKNIALNLVDEGLRKRDENLKRIG